MARKNLLHGFRTEFSYAARQGRTAPVGAETWREQIMAREKIKCPGCDCKVLLSDIEKNDGACPECGQQVFVARQSQLFNDYDSRSSNYTDDDEEMDDGNIDMDDENPDYYEDDYEDDDDRELLGDVDEDEDE